jgi:hypothetical protein
MKKASYILRPCGMALLTGRVDGFGYTNCIYTNKITREITKMLLYIHSYTGSSA